MVHNVQQKLPQGLREFLILKSAVGDSFVHRVVSLSGQEDGPPVLQHGPRGFEIGKAKITGVAESNRRVLDTSKPHAVHQIDMGQGLDNVLVRGCEIAVEVLVRKQCRLTEQAIRCPVRVIKMRTQDGRADSHLNELV